MNEMQVFNYGEQEVRTVLIDDDPWWVLADVCGVLNLKQPHRVASRLDEDEKGRTQMTTPGGSQDMTVINESGLYSVILRSDKQEAKAFKRWVTHEVLPAIRKSGKYVVPAAKPQMSVETGLQRAGLIIRAAEHKAVPQSEQLRLLNIAIKDLTGTGINFTPDAQQTMPVSLMDLPETTGILKKGKTKRNGRYSIQFHTLTEIADMAGVSAVAFNDFAEARGIKNTLNGEWVRVNTPQGEAREFLYANFVLKQYREEMV